MLFTLLYRRYARLNESNLAVSHSRIAVESVFAPRNVYCVSALRGACWGLALLKKKLLFEILNSNYPANFPPLLTWKVFEVVVKRS